ncbi:LTA synthase family protein [Thermomonas hydrothermalis]|uniref:LTA synthase family protein n=1 Tax=Thermomonas hydrothermalis TaxID=213588 RepID=UPI001FE27E6E|nr:LTA synthase family protein [Thermomonas hydrothermalis]
MVAAALTGLGLSVAIECLMQPRPPLARPWSAWALHGGLWLLAHALLTLLLGRPWFAAAAVSAFWLMLVLVNNAKVHALREPFVFQDFEYFTDAIRHPRLYIPFLGWWKFLGAAAGFVLAVAIGLWGEAVPAERWRMASQLGGIALMGLAGIGLILTRRTRRLAVTFQPERDIGSLGFAACLWRYGEEERVPLTAASPFDFLAPEMPDGGLPHLVAVQSESFFDPRPWFAGIRAEVLAEFDRLKGDALAHGRLDVPAWGANTVRTEFAFLTGIGEDKLGVHRFNPHRAIAAGSNVSSLALWLKRFGYRTICIHPYPASFYQRDRVYPRIGFDEFLDIRAFDKAGRFGPYIGDAAVAEKIAAVLGEATGPVFIFAITMENHGPLHLEKVNPENVDAFYHTPPPDDCDDLTIYLRHLRNADRMIGALRQTLEGCPHPASLCWFGDHVPIMPKVYEIFGEPDGVTEYVIWSNRMAAQVRPDALAANELTIRWLGEAGLIGFPQPAGV